MLKMYAVQFLEKKNKVYVLRDLGFNSQAEALLKDGKATLSRLKFNTTSYNLNVILIFNKGRQNSFSYCDLS